MAVSTQPPKPSSQGQVAPVAGTHKVVWHTVLVLTVSWARSLPGHWRLSLAMQKRLELAHLWVWRISNKKLTQKITMFP